MGILNNFETWARSDSNKDTKKKSRRFEPWARPNKKDYTRPSSNPATDIDEDALYNPHSEYHGYNPNTDDVNDFGV